MKLKAEICIHIYIKLAISWHHTLKIKQKLISEILIIFRDTKKLHVNPIQKIVRRGYIYVGGIYFGISK